MFRHRAQPAKEGHWWCVLRAYIAADRRGKNTFFIRFKKVSDDLMHNNAAFWRNNALAYHVMRPDSICFHSQQEYHQHIFLHFTWTLTCLRPTSARRRKNTLSSATFQIVEELRWCVLAVYLRLCFACSRSGFSCRLASAHIIQVGHAPYIRMVQCGN